MKFCSFSVSGGAYCYQMGIAKHIQRHFDLSDVLFSGASGGTWPALLLAAGVDIQYAFDVMMKKSVPCYEKRFLGAYGCYDLGMKAAFYHIFGGVDLPAKVNGRLALTVTRIELWPVPHLENESVSHFTSNDDIIDCIIASALIPFALNGKPYVVYRNWICMDGGMTNIAGVRNYSLPSQLDFDEDTTKEDNMHIVARLNAVLAVFSTLKGSLQQVSGNMQYFRPFAEHPISIPMAIEPFGVYGHSVSIVRSVAQEIYHDLIERVETLPNAAKETLAKMFHFSQHEGNLSSVVDHVNITSEAELPHWGTNKSEEPVPVCHSNTLDRLLGWIFGSMKSLSYDIENLSQKKDAEDSWWVRNEFQLQRAKLLSSSEKDNNLSCVSSCSDFSMVTVEKDGSSRGESFDNSNAASLELFRQAAGEGDVDNEQSFVDSTTDTATCSSESCEENYATNDSMRNSSITPRCAGHCEVDLAAKPKFNQTADARVYWRKKAEAVSATPCGGTQLLITPWMWRKLPLSAYHLTSKGEKAAVLLELGFIDAAEHHMELLKFFNPGDYVNALVRDASS